MKDEKNKNGWTKCVTIIHTNVPSEQHTPTQGIEASAKLIGFALARKKTTGNE